jgi:hypothetical protein
MATLIDVINVLQTTADAMAGLEGFTYGNRSEINTQGEKQYPRLLIDRNLNVNSMDLIKGRRVYSFQLQFFSLFHRDVEALNTDQAEQQNLLNIAEQYLKEIRARFDATRRMRIVNDTVSGGDFVFNYGNDRLLRLQFPLQIEVFTDACVNGVFNYGV